MLIWICSFLIAILMGMGIGGGGLFVIYLTLCMNFPQVIASGTNLFFFALAGLSSLFVHLRKRKIRLWQVCVMIPFGSIGSIIFSNIASFTEPKYARIVLGIILIVSGILTLYNSFIKDIIKKFKKGLYK